MPLVDLRSGRERITWVEIKRALEGGKHLPERIITTIVEIKSGILTFMLRKTVDQCTYEPQIHKTSGHFFRSSIRVLHWQSGESTKAIAMFFDLFRQRIIGSMRDLYSTNRIVDALNSRCI